MEMYAWILQNHSKKKLIKISNPTLIIYVCCLCIYKLRKRYDMDIHQQARCQDLTAGGAKTRRRCQKPEGGATFLKCSIGCMQQPVGQTWNGGTPISNGGPDATGPPADDGPVHQTASDRISEVPCVFRAFLTRSQRDFVWWILFGLLK